MFNLFLRRDITNLAGPLTPDQVEKLGRQFSKDHPRSSLRHEQADEESPVRRSPRLNGSPHSPTKTPFSPRSPYTSAFKAKAKSSPGLKSVLTPLKKQGNPPPAPAPAPAPFFLLSCEWCVTAFFYFFFVNKTSLQDRADCPADARITQSPPA